MAASLKQIAEHLDLSVATVSRALQNNPRISDETRHRVTSTAAQMGYRVRTAKAELKGAAPQFYETLEAPPGVITVLAQFDVEAWESGQFSIGPVPFHGGEASSSMNRMLAGITKAARALHLSALVHYVPLSECYSVVEPAYQPAAMRAFQTTGIITVGQFPPETIERLSQTWTIVSLSHHYADQGVTCVTADSLDAIAQQMDVLYARGHRRIGFLNYMGHETWAQMRYAGYIQSLSRLGLPYVPEILANIDDRVITPKRELEIVLRHFHQGADVTAWICADDVVAYRLFDDLRQHGIRVPEELSITGFNAMQPPSGFPLMSGINAPFGIMGGLAVQTLLDRVAKPHLPPWQTLIRCELVPGETLGPPRSG